MPWNDYPLRSITIPADHGPTDSYIYVGNDDPVAAMAGVDSAIVFHFGAFNSAFLLGVEDNSAPGDDEGHFQLTGYSDQQLNPFRVIFVDWNPFLLGGVAIFGDNSQYSDTVLQGNQGITMTVIQNDDGYVTMNDGAVGYGLQVTSITAIVPTAAFAAENIVAVLPSHDYSWQRAYRVRVEGGFTPSAAGSYCDMRLKKTNIAGQTLGEFFRFPAAAAGVVTAVHGSRVFKVLAGFSVTATLVITMQTAVGTIIRFGSATSPFTVSVEDCGPADFYPDAPILV